jgi:hypothetical protein
MRKNPWTIAELNQEYIEQSAFFERDQESRAH